MKKGSAGGEGTDHKRAYILRKLCSGVDEYEAAPTMDVTPDRYALMHRLESMGYEAVIQGPLLTVLMEDIGVVANVHLSGRMTLKSNLKEEAEKACGIIFALMVDKKGGRTEAGEADSEPWSGDANGSRS